MQAATEGLLINIVSSIIWELTCKLLEIAKQKRKDEQLAELVERAFKKYENSLLDSGVFHKYIKAAQVSDLIHNFTLYRISGLVPEDIKKVRRLKGLNEISEKDIIDYLTDNAQEYCRGQIRAISKTEVESFFRQVFTTSREYFAELLSTEDKGMFFLLNYRFDMLSENLRKSLAIEVQKNTSPNWKETKNQYNSLLLRNNEKGFIYGLSEFKLQEFYVFPELRREGPLSLRTPRWTRDVIFDEKMQRQLLDIDPIHGRNRCSWGKIFDYTNILYVIGGPGYGKSLFLKNIVNNYAKMNIPDAEDHLVIYCDLKSFYKFAKESPYSIVEFLQDSMIASTGLDRESLSKEMVHHFLNLGRCFILFDALDEVPKEHRGNLHTLLISFFAEHNQNNKICITSRSRGFLPKDDIDVFSICPIDVAQIRKYLDNMIKLRYFSRDNIDPFLAQVKVLMEKNFLTNFLALSLIITIYKAERELPETKLELYSKCFEYIAKKREQEKSRPKYDWAIINPIMKDSTFIELSLLAAPNNKTIAKDSIVDMLLDLYKNKYSDECSAESAINAFLDFCAERTEFFVNSNEEDSFQFFHRSFFEFFYAKYIIRREKPEEIYGLLMQFDVDSEVFELSISMIKAIDEAKYQNVVGFLFKKTIEDLTGASPTLFPLNILTSIMYVIDDVKHRNTYLDIFLQYSSTLVLNASKINSSKLLIGEIENAFSTNQSYRTQFIEKYEFFCFLRLLMFFRENGKLFDKHVVHVELKEDVPRRWLGMSRFFAEIDPISIILLKNCSISDMYNDNLAVSQGEFSRNLSELVKDKKLKKEFCSRFAALKKAKRELIDQASEFLRDIFESTIGTRDSEAC